MKNCERVISLGVSKKAIVLGGTNPHIRLIQNLKRRGYYTILVDYAEQPVAKAHADEHIIESSLDKERVLEIAKRRNVDLVITTCSDQANVTACYVAEKLGLPAPYSYETSLNVTNKLLMKKIMYDNNIPTSRYVQVVGDDRPDYSELSFPLIIKPADSYGSRGVRKAFTSSEVERHVKDALLISKIDSAIIEEYVEGEEINVYCFVVEGEVHVLMLSHKYNIIDHDDAVVQSYAAVAPANLSVEVDEKIRAIAQQIANAFGLKTTSLFIQVIVNGSDVKVVEFAPRVGGGLSFRTVKINTGFDILNATVDSFLGIKPDMNYAAPRSLLSINNLYGQAGTFGSIEGGFEI